MYADFLLPRLVDGFRVLDVGCGAGTITLGLASEIGTGDVLGVDVRDDFGAAREYAIDHGIGNVEFRVGDVYDLELPSDHFDACFCHSMLETLERPLDGLREIRRVLRLGGVLAVACVEYGGLILAGPDVALLRRFYAVRERLWQLHWHADPYRGIARRSAYVRSSCSCSMKTTRGPFLRSSRKTCSGQAPMRISGRGSRGSSGWKTYWIHPSSSLVHRRRHVSLPSASTSSCNSTRRSCSGWSRQASWT